MYFNCRKDSKRCRELWWQGVPAKVRGELWSQVIGNEIDITRGERNWWNFDAAVWSLCSMIFNNSFIKIMTTSWTLISELYDGLMEQAEDKIAKQLAEQNKVCREFFSRWESYIYRAVKSGKRLLWHRFIWMPHEPLLLLACSKRMVRTMIICFDYWVLTRFFVRTLAMFSQWRLSLQFCWSKWIRTPPSSLSPTFLRDHFNLLSLAWNSHKWRSISLPTTDTSSKSCRLFINIWTNSMFVPTSTSSNGTAPIILVIKNHQNLSGSLPCMPNHCRWTWRVVSGMCTSVTVRSSCLKRLWGFWECTSRNFWRWTLTTAWNFSLVSQTLWLALNCSGTRNRLWDHTMESLLVPRNVFHRYISSTEATLLIHSFSDFSRSRRACQSRRNSRPHPDHPQRSRTQNEQKSEWFHQGPSFVTQSLDSSLSL